MSMRIALALAMAALGLVFGETTRAADRTPGVGHWEGVLEARNRSLPVRFDFGESGGHVSGRFSIDRWRVMDYPLEHLEMSGGRVAFHLGDNTLQGVVEGDVIRGTFKGGDGEGTFTVRRRVKPALPYREIPVTFHNGPVVLSGTLLAPATGGRHPAVVLLQGSGPEVRWGTNRYIADRFARAGVVALLYDKRGAGGSSGDWRSAGYEDLARDALAGVALLAARPDVDPRRIGLHGHSEGGMVAPLAATLAPEKVAFLIAEDTFVGEVKDQDIYRTNLEIQAEAFSEADKRKEQEMFHLFIAVLSGDRPYSDLEAVSAPVKDEAWFKDLNLPARTDPIWTTYRARAHFDTRTAWRKVRQPVLLVYGEHDQLVPVDESIRAIEGYLDASGTPYAALIAPLAEHNLTIKAAKGEPPFWWRQAPGVFDAVVAWAKACTAGGPCVARGRPGS
jgi:pimeloyl-ACP methyl ester carboxylesterase